MGSFLVYPFFRNAVSGGRYSTQVSIFPMPVSDSRILMFRCCKGTKRCDTRLWRQNPGTVVRASPAHATIAYRISNYDIVCVFCMYMWLLKNSLLYLVISQCPELYRLDTNICCQNTWFHIVLHFVVLPISTSFFYALEHSLCMTNIIVLAYNKI